MKLEFLDEFVMPEIVDKLRNKINRSDNECTVIQAETMGLVWIFGYE